MAAMFVIWSNEHRMWWGPDRRGYTPYLEEAGRYDFPTATEIVASARLGGPYYVASWLPRMTGSFGPTLTIGQEHIVLAPEYLQSAISGLESRVDDAFASRTAPADDA